MKTEKLSRSEGVRILIYERSNKLNFCTYFRTLLFLVTIYNCLHAQEFVLQTHHAGIRTVNETNGVALADYDGDGDVDIYFVAKSPYKPYDMRTWNRLFSNNDDGTFTDVTLSAGIFVTANDSLTAYVYQGVKFGASWGDYDNDGFPDLFVTMLGPNYLFHNNGDLTFTDVTKQAGVSGNPTQLNTSALWFDYDLDGDLDLYVATWRNDGGDNLDNLMYENMGDGIFVDVSDSSRTADKGHTWTTIALDVNNDDYLDLYLANDFGYNKLYINNGNKTFSEETENFNLTNRYSGMGLAVADIDRNGYFDIYLTNITEDGFLFEKNPLYLNTGDNYFIDVAEEAGVSRAGWGWGTDFVDIDNDGDEDLFVVTGDFEADYSNRLFKNISGSDSLLFKDISIESGLNDYIYSRGLAIFDYDADGDQDFLISNFRDLPFLYVNQMGHGNWLEIELEGTEINRNAFGSVIELRSNEIIVSKYHHGAQFLGQNILPVHFGLGDVEMIDTVRVTWLGGKSEEFYAISANQKIKIIEGGILITNIAEKTSEIVNTPKKLELLGNYPNPFNGSTEFRFYLQTSGEVELQIFNMLGQKIHTIYRIFTSAGQKNIHWHTAYLGASQFSSGVYLYRIRQNDHISDVKKLIYLK
jgi:hypothetical protein